MTVPFIVAKNFAAGKREVTWGTQLAPAAADFNVRIRDLSFDPQTEMYLTPFQSGRHSFSEPVPGKRMCGLKFKVDMRCGASAGTPPKLGKFFEACGALETVILTFSGALVTSNSVAGSVNGVALTPVVFSGSESTTLGLIRDAIVAALAAQTPTVVATGVVDATNHLIKITRTTPNATCALTAFVVTLGSSQATASYSVVYNPQGGIDPTTATITSMDAASMSAAFYFTPPTGNALIVSVKGWMGNGKVMMDDLGQPLYAEFDGKGCLVGIADGALIALTSPDTSIPPAVIGVAITLNSVVQRIGKFELDFGNDVQLKYDPADTSGYIAAYIAKREPRLRINPQTALLATDPVYTRWQLGAAYVFSLATATSSGVKWTVAAQKAVLLTLKPAERNGEAIWEQEHQLIETSGNDEWSITQSA